MSNKRLLNDAAGVAASPSSHNTCLSDFLRVHAGAPSDDSHRMPIFDISNKAHKPNSRDYWKSRALVAEEKLRVSVQDSGVKYEDLLLTYSPSEREQRMEEWGQSLLECDALEWDGHMMETYVNAPQWSDIIDTITSNKYNPLKYALHVKKLSHDEAEQYVEDRQCHHQYGLAYVSEIVLRLKSQHQVPFFQSVMAVDMYARATPVAVWDNLRALRLLPGREWTNKLVTALLDAFYRRSRGKLSRLQNAAYDNHEYHIKLTFQRVDADAEFLHTVNSIWFPCLEEDHHIDEDEYGE